MRIWNPFEKKPKVPKDFSEGKYMNDLFKVGKNKPLGYLPIETITRICKVDIRELEIYTEKIGKKFLVVKDGKYFFYVYDEKILQDFLDKNREKLLRNNWPTTSLEFVEQVGSRFADNQEMFDLIADAFADKKNPGRSENGGHNMFGGKN